MVRNGFHRFCQRQPTNEIKRLRRIKSLTFETINDFHKNMEIIAALFDGFVLIMYANYYVLMKISRARIHIQY